MFCVTRPSFEVVKEGRILNKIKHLQLTFLSRIDPSRQAGPVKYGLCEGFTLFHRAGSFLFGAIFLWILPDQGSLLSDKFLMKTHGLDVAIFLSSYQSQILTLADKQ
jgi:hypothetical protein